MSLLQSWRWYGPNDPVTLIDIKQAGATDIVSALHQVPHGEVWTVEEIEQRKHIIEAAGLKWTVVESVPVHESIKTGAADCQKYLDNYNQTLRNLASSGLKIVCYNFMPVLDWTRTTLDYELTDGSRSLLMDWVDLAVFDIYLLKREGADRDYAANIAEQAELRFKGSTPEGLQLLKDNILMGVPTEGSTTIAQLHQSLAIYNELGPEGLRKNLLRFLDAIEETCNESGIKMTLHPDDPPYSILGLPRIATSKEDLLYIIENNRSVHNGICFCTGSLGAGVHNEDIAAILKAVGHRVYFAHLRNVTRVENNNFYESGHLKGDVDMYAVMKELVAINQQRTDPIPYRPDHGLQMLDDLHKITNPGYSAIGRLKGLAELRGLEYGLESSA
ncbi:mannonate dehydratase [Pedobacter psychroterrae]|uniref:Mannonate dehydratase n=1 Tax=Pedobacter psychroterrae TaxID=2530453 RepID=A0A4R0NGU9_9SPHI|nr:mannonate dehydratase [Pedobacter psychroterrae]TCC99799.1 mannonate dehydratase [Pedobacter psychroterrae]